MSKTSQTLCEVSTSNQGTTGTVAVSEEGSEIKAYVNKLGRLAAVEQLCLQQG